MYMAWGLIQDVLDCGCVFPVLCEVLCHSCYKEILEDEDYFPEPYTYFSVIVSDKPLKCDQCGNKIYAKAFMVNLEKEGVNHEQD